MKRILLIILLGILILIGIIFIPGFFHNSTSTNQYQVKSASLLKLDKVIESPHFAIYFHNEDESKARELIGIYENDYTSLTKYFKELPKTEVLLTYDADEYVNDFNASPPWGGADRYKDPGTSAGAFCPGCTKSLGKNTEYVYLLRPKTRTFAHEFSHRYYWANYLNIRTKNDLTWLNEGLAVYAQTEIAKGPGGLSSTNLPNIKGFSLPNNFSDLNLLQQKGSTDMFYDLVGLMAYYISVRANDPGLQKFITELNRTSNLEQSTQKVLQVSSSQLFSGWKEAVENTATQNPKDFLATFKSFVSAP